MIGKRIEPSEFNFPFAAKLRRQYLTRSVLEIFNNKNQLVLSMIHQVVCDEISDTIRSSNL